MSLPFVGLYNVYAGGGYIEQFEVNRLIASAKLQELFKNLWINRQTRVLLLEFTLVSPQTNLFIYNVFAVEFPATGGTVTSYTIYPLRIFQQIGSTGTFIMISEIVFCLLLVLLLVNISVRAYQQRWGFCRQFWSVFDLIMWCLGVAGVVLYTFRVLMALASVREFKTRLKYHINFGHVVYWDRLFILALSLLAFMTTIRFLSFLETSKNVKAVVKIFKRCGTDLFWNGATFFYTMLAFAVCSYLLFGSMLLSYGNVLKSMSTLFIALIGKSKYNEINATRPVLAGLFFIVFIFTMVFLFLTIFLSILGAAVDEVIHDTRKDKRRGGVIEHTVKVLADFFRAQSQQLKKMGRSPEKDRIEERKNENIKG